MGNTTNLVIIMTMIYLFSAIIVLGVVVINPDSPSLLGNSLLNNNNNNLLSITTKSNNTIFYTFNYSSTGFNNLGSTAQLETDAFKVPDWNKAANNWFNKGINEAKSPMSVIISFVGAPYTLFYNSGIPADLSALLGVAFGVITTLIFANWLFGRDT